MFYVKTELSDGNACFKQYITDENVYTRCYKCGLEFPVDIVGASRSDPDFDLFGTAFMCPDCSAKHKSR